MNKLRIEAERLRDKGYSYALIHKKLGIAKGTMSYWFKDRPFTPNKEVLERVQAGRGKSGLIRHEQRIREIATLKKEGTDELGQLSKRDLWLLGLGLYIGEGAKTTEMIRITNADPNVIRISIRWLEEICGISKSNLTIRIHIYPDNDPDDCLRYWQRVTGIPKTNFRKASVDLRTNKQSLHSRKLPYGTAHVTVLSKGDSTKGVRLFRRINGWIYGALNQV